MSERMRRHWLGHPVVGAICRLLLGGAFVYANYSKLLQPVEVARLISAYRIFHPDLLNLTGIIFPWIGLIPGVLLVLGLWVRSAALLLGSLLVAFIGAAVLVIMRGLEIECGCFLPLVGDRVDWVMVFRDSVFLLLAIQVMVWPSSFFIRKPHPPSPSPRAERGR